jgi:hypothetical protein
MKGQEKLKLNINNELSIKDIHYIRLFKYDINNYCNQSRAIKIIHNDSISPCFDFVKKIDATTSKNIFSLLNKKSTYGNENMACFDTDYAMIVYDKSDAIIGTVQLSLDCNKVMIKPCTEALNYYDNLKFSPIGLSIYSRKKLLSLCKIKD